MNLGGDPGFNGKVRTMVLDEDGNLYCAGDFTSVDGIDRQWERGFIDEPIDLTTQPTCFGRV